MELLCVSRNFWDVKKFFWLWHTANTELEWKRRKRKWMTRKAHLKINKVSVDVLILCLMAQYSSLGAIFLPVTFPVILMIRRKERFQQTKNFLLSEKSFQLQLLHVFISRKCVSSNIEKSNYCLMASWTSRRQIKLNCLLCEVL